MELLNFIAEHPIISTIFGIILASVVVHLFKYLSYCYVNTLSIIFRKEQLPPPKDELEEKIKEVFNKD
ncbi:MAG: hypothetical protein NZZ41_03900 [Candidatus Dojkabacteria bacterium]|nr:hypothetical protein [Candidatus Dojkabacteria bacterium]